MHLHSSICIYESISCVCKSVIDHTLRICTCFGCVIFVVLKIFLYFLLQLRIQFNDTSTTFEYPSEASLLEDDFQNISTSSEQSFSSPSADMVNVPCSSPKVSPLSKYLIEVLLTI